MIRRWRAPDLTDSDLACLASLDLADEAERRFGRWSHADRSAWEQMLRRELARKERRKDESTKGGDR